MSATAVNCNTTPETALFLKALFIGKPDNLYFLLWTLPEKRSNWFQSVESAIRFAESRRDRDLYAAVGLSGRDYGATRRCPSHQVAGIVGLWVDLDLKSEAHPGNPLPPTIEDALEILPPELPPTLVVHTGNGAHVWWLFREPWIFESAEEGREAEDLIRRWQTDLLSKARARGWHLDRLCDLARVLRVPGTRNCKDPKNVKPVVIRLLNDQRYNPSEFTEYLDDREVVDSATDRATACEYTGGFRDTPLMIDLLARIPEDRLNRWIETNPRFKATWFRQRQDLHDQSQSGYDLALAHFGFAAKLSFQEIVDLIVHHRVQHKQQHRTRLDYFERTLSKAASNADPCHPSGACMTVALDASKGAICCKLSEILGVTILRITKISGHSPIFHMELADGKIEFSDIGKLLNQTSLRNKLAAVAGKVIRRFGPKEWQQITQFLLDACTVEEGGEEMQLEGAARLRLNQYLSAMPFITSIEGQNNESCRRPMIAADRVITVCASDIQIFIAKTGQENASIPATVAMLHAVGAKTERFRGGFPEQTRWLLPRDKFPAADYLSPSESGGVDDGQ